jgi:hypothetical protein
MSQLSANNARAHIRTECCLEFLHKAMEKAWNQIVGVAVVAAAGHVRLVEISL